MNQRRSGLSSSIISLHFSFVYLFFFLFCLFLHRVSLLFCHFGRCCWLLLSLKLSVVSLFLLCWPFRRFSVDVIGCGPVQISTAIRFQLPLVLGLWFCRIFLPSSLLPSHSSRPCCLIPGELLVRNPGSSQRRWSWAPCWPGGGGRSGSQFLVFSSPGGFPNVLENPPQLLFWIFENWAGIVGRPRSWRIHCRESWRKLIGPDR